MRKKALSITFIWVIVAVVILALFLLREVTPVKEFIAWAVNTWVIVAAIGGLGVLATGWVIRHDFSPKRKVSPTKALVQETESPLEDIKANLVKINAFEREAAIRKTKQPCPENVAMQIHDDCLAIWGASLGRLIMPILWSVIMKHDPDPLINFFKGFGDILDSNKYGLKTELQTNELYKSFRINVAQERLHLSTDRKKRSITQKNIDRVLSLTYGLNSAIILRGVLDSISTGKTRIPAFVRIGLEGVEALGEKTSSQMLDNLEDKWKPALNLAELPDVISKLSTALSTVNTGMGMAEGVTSMTRKNEEQELLAFYQRQKENWKSNLRLRITCVTPTIDANVPKVTFQMEMMNYLPIQVKLVKVTHSSGNVSAGEFGSVIYLLSQKRWTSE